ncbi:MAG TPA: hypothetical protein VNT60_08660 [Deinococcales bacterium]|nr:hypothetical protein [Deinococcales bacterium]
MANEPHGGAHEAPDQHEHPAGGAHDHPSDGSHEIAGFRVGVNPIPFGVLLVLIFIVLIAMFSWVPVYGF